MYYNKLYLLKNKTPDWKILRLHGSHAKKTHFQRHLEASRTKVAL